MLSACVAFAVAALVVLVAINRGAYDDGHLTSVMMVAAGHLPQTGDCDECFQPKLYYVVSGLLARAAFVDPANRTAVRIVAQIVSGCAGLLTFWLGWRMLAETAFSPRVRGMAFALFACNPSLIAMFVQATNDAFAILFGSLVVLLTLRLVRTPLDHPLDPRAVALLALACIAVSVSKATGLALSAAVAFLLVWRLAAGLRSGSGLRANTAALAIFALPYLLTVPLLGGYAQNAMRGGTPVGIGVARSTPPGFFTDRPTGQTGALGRTGVLSVVGGYLTLRPFDLFEVPWHRSGQDDLGSARTSLWTQVFARSHFVFFEQWPLQWLNETSTVVLLGRAIFILGWITTGFTLIGFGAAVVAVFKRQGAAAAWPAFWSEPGAASILMSTALAALIAFTYTYRNEGAMKPLYVYPALLCAVWAFAYGVSFVRARVLPARAAIFDAAVGTSVVAVCGLYVAQLLTLVQTIVANGI